ncbi:hypothetical protein GCM10022237_36590 [Nocardioides ginsengisoli]|uniref:MauE/DoxX family redox-associated membrane protein n=1 Tax=Nocardioides ginsengisoli TaxID=363868 RepID=A0ABW3VUU6_9ACTN
MTVLLAAALSVTLLASGLAKLPRARAATTADALAAGGLPLPVVLVRTAAAVEVLLAVGLLAAGTAMAVVVGIAVLALLAGYTAVLVRVWRSGSDGGCGCHGQAGGRVSRWTLARNGLLLAGAVVVLAARSPGVVGVVGAMVVAVAAVLLVVALPGPARAPVVPVEPLVAAPGDYVRWPVPDAPLVDAAGARLSLRDLCRDGARVLVVVDGRRAVPPEVDAWLARVAVGAAIVRPVVVAAFVARPGRGNGTDTFADPTGVVARMLGGLLPSVTVLGADGWLAGGPAGGVAAADRLVGDLVGELDVPALAVAR